MDGPIDVAGIKQLQAELHWIKNGDRNSKYIHACANQRKKGNFISQILDENGWLCTTNADIANAFVQYYQHLFTTTKLKNIGDCIHAIERKVSPEMNMQLVSEFTMEEISHALSQMQPLKAPGSNGFTSCFYQQNWETIGGEYVRLYLVF